MSKHQIQLDFHDLKVFSKVHTKFQFHCFTNLRLRDWFQDDRQTSRDFETPGSKKSYKGRRIWYFFNNLWVSNPSIRIHIYWYIASLIHEPINALMHSIESLWLCKRIGVDWNSENKNYYIESNFLSKPALIKLW